MSSVRNFTRNKLHMYFSRILLESGYFLLYIENLGTAIFKEHLSVAASVVIKENHQIN